MKKAVFLDRDGVINEVKTERVTFVNRPEQFYFLEGVLEAIKLLTDSDFLIFVVTNQGGVGLGYLSHKQLQSIHDHMLREIEKAGGFIQEVSCCTHKPHEGCKCRKPEAGMLLDLARKHDIDIAQSYMVGDREVDIEAGRKAGCTTVLLSDSSPHLYEADHMFTNLMDAAEFILTNK
ncbi:HAD-IIIA family hydrolase [Rossellomorea aquimaris]|uniref:D,D-heptose 1,7-bisphosphate phosphatase n=1 Tax=Rossellomorea aquimaris TaxID=189382 RepID=A0A366F0B7_9BACI|nr:HAD family hydrolase [Rossellomorea aquimaris]RBP08091.1 D-glycero-D-manno-heptose 1,7-bisphosphate phosphatase [Rossellomorea aquimaris]